MFPKIGARLMAYLRPREVIDIIKGIGARGAAETAGRVLQRVNAVFRYAVAHELTDTSPLLDLTPSELLKPRQVRRRSALTDKELPAFLAALDAYTGDPTTKAALRLLMLTAVCPGELCGARCAEIDRDAAWWRIPAERTKMKAPQVVPLSTAALALLADMRGPAKLARYLSTLPWHLHSAAQTVYPPAPPSGQPRMGRAML